MRIRIRGPKGQSVIVLSGTATVGDLRQQIQEKTSIADADVKYGYPPQPLPLQDHSDTTKLSDLGIKLEGEQLIISERTALPPPLADATPTATATASKPLSRASSRTTPLSLTKKQKEMDPPEIPIPPYNSTLVLRIMPDDNSCLFRAFNSAYMGAMDNMHELRSIIAQYIQANKSDYPAVVLEKDPDDYCKWIQEENSWGGAIELDILSKHFDIEICSIDVQSLRVDKFNDGQSSRCILVYSGIHYDVIALSPSDYPYTRALNPPEFDTKVFDANDPMLLEESVKLCKILQGQHYFTDTAGFEVKCNQCGGRFRGEKGATEHAAKTGHWDFGES
ncbi:MAG: ubiquitin-specific protease otu1 [Icmadophila ericetorum]|nr:ubiquitin-specific protease otu1 [Icmadophila ericetorum]